jgi:hypothetical protein
MPVSNRELTMVNCYLLHRVIWKLTKHQAIKRLELREIAGIPIVNRVAVLLDPMKYTDYVDCYGKPGADSLFDGVDTGIVLKWCAWYRELLESRDGVASTIKPKRKRWDPKPKRRGQLAASWGPEWTRVIDPSKRIETQQRRECMLAN